MMADNHNTPTITRHSSDIIKEPDERLMTATDTPGNAQTEKASVEDEHSKEASKEEEKEEKEGSLKDYFVSHNRPG
jgi:ribosomal protein L12E/L44/L45/RPP1/RPP2